MKSFKKLNNYINKRKQLFSNLILFLFFFFVLIVYLHNITRDVYAGDIGDLVTAAYVFGVPHPPGYPLFTFLGYLFSHYLPVALPPVSKVAIISVLASFIGLIFFYKFSFRVTKSIFISLLSTAILGFSYFYWLHAEIPEVFALNNLFAILILYYSIIFYQEKKPKHLYLVVFLCGLSLTHHQTILFTFPAVLLLVIKHFRFVFFNPKRVLLMIFLFLLGLLPFIYIPIAASHNPVINWNNAVNLENFIKLVSRKAYGDFAPPLFAIPLDVKFIIVADYFKAIAADFSYLILFVFLLGFIYLFKKDKWIFSSLLLAYFLSGPFFIFYCAVYALSEVHMGVIERFYVLSSIIFMFFVVYGFLFLRNLGFAILLKKFYTYAILACFLIVPYFQIIYNSPKTDLSKTTLGRDMVYDMLSAIPKDSILLLSGDNETFNTWYMHYVLGYRKDIIMINAKSVQPNNYIEREKKKYKQKHPNVDEKKLLYYTYEELRKKKKIYSVASFNVDRSTILIPKGLVYEIVNIKDIPPEDIYEKEINRLVKNFHVPRRDTLKPYNNNLIAMEAPTLYSEAFIQIATFFGNYYNDTSKAEFYYKKALQTDTSYHHAYAGMGINQYNKSQDCSNAAKNIKKAIDLYPIKREYYQYLYVLYKKCHVPKSQLAELQKTYKLLFNKDIEKKSGN